MTISDTISFAPTNELLFPGYVPFTSEDATTYLTPTVGPTAIMLVTRMAQYVYLADHVEPLTISFGYEELARTFGLNHTTLRKALHRAVMFDLLRATPDDHLFRIPRGVRMKRPWVEHLPTYLRDSFGYAVAP